MSNAPLMLRALCSSSLGSDTGQDVRSVGGVSVCPRPCTVLTVVAALAVLAQRI